jgi:hypothetical protein
LRGLHIRTFVGETRGRETLWLWRDAPSRI